MRELDANVHRVTSPTLRVSSTQRFKDSTCSVSLQIFDKNTMPKRSHPPLASIMPRDNSNPKNLSIWVYPKIMVPPNHPKPSILGYPYFWKQPNNFPMIHHYPHLSLPNSCVRGTLNFCAASLLWSSGASSLKSCSQSSLEEIFKNGNFKWQPNVLGFL